MIKECYDIGSADWADYTPPVDEACHIKAQFDYLNFINNENTVNIIYKRLKCHIKKILYNCIYFFIRPTIIHCLRYKVLMQKKLRM